MHGIIAAYFFGGGLN